VTGPCNFAAHWTRVGPGCIIAVVIAVLCGTEGGAAAQGGSDSQFLYARRQTRGETIAPGTRVVEEYSSFRWVLVARGASSAALPSSVEREYPPLVFRNRTLQPGPVSSRMTSTWSSQPGRFRAYLIQFSAPIKTGTWLEQLQKTGLRPLTYIPANGYLAWASGRQLLQALTLQTSTGFPMIHAVEEVSWEDRLEPALKTLSEGARAPWVEPSWASGGAIPVHIWAFDADLTDQVLSAVRTDDPHPARVDDAGNLYLSASLSLADIQSLVKSEPAIQYVEIVRPKVLHNNLASLLQICNVEPEWTAGWNGAGVVVDHNDSGVDLTHPDFPTGVIVATSGKMSKTDNGHGTHTAGSVVGRGLAGSSPADTYACGDQYSGESAVRGMADGAALITNNIFSGGVTGDSSMMQWGVQHGAALSTNSWGYGTESSPDTTYDSHAIAMDKAVRDADSGSTGNQPLAIFFSAGNSGSGASTVASPGLAKDVITVGASQNARCGSYVPAYQSGPNINTVVDFSSRGPSQGRLKPDICAPGTDVLSTQSQDSRATYPWDQSWTGTYYALDSGTSMSCPLAAGLGADFYQFYRSTFGSSPSPALVKAALINGAADMGAGYPSNAQGWGRANVKNSIEGPSGGSIAFLDQSDTTPVGTGGQYTKQFSVTTSTVPLKITLVWTDPPGAASCTRCLVNDLDLEVLAPGGTAYHGNQFTAAWSATDPSGWDSANNVENVFVQAPATGLWTIHVNGRNVPTIPAGVTGGQDFAVVYSGPLALSTTTPTGTNTPTTTPTATDTPTGTPTSTPTATPTATAINTSTSTNTPTPIPTDTPTPTSTRTSTDTPTPTPSETPTSTATAMPTSTNTPTASPTDTLTQTPTRTPTATPSNTPTATPTETPTSTATTTPTGTPSQTTTNTPTSTDTPTTTPTRTPTGTATNTPSPTLTLSKTPTGTSTSTPTSTLSPSATSTPSTSPTATPSTLSVPTASPTPTGPVLQTTLRVGRAAAYVGQTGIVIPVTTTAAITVGSTDVVLTFDAAVLQAVSCTSAALSSFAYAVDNLSGAVTTASTSESGDSLGAGAELFHCTLDVRSDAARGPSVLGLRDADGVPPDDLAGVSPPIPPPSIPYAIEPGSVLVGAGDIACSGPISAIDASVLLCRFVGDCQDSDFPPPCNDPALRVQLSDWDCSGTLTPVDASITLAIVVGRIQFEDTPLVQGCGGGGG
jgi:subtilisin family serine protease